MAWYALCGSEHDGGSFQDLDRCTWCSKKKYRRKKNAERCAERHRCWIKGGSATAIQMDGRNLRDMKWGD